MIIEIIVGIAVIFAGLMALASARAIWVAPDALTRTNVLGPTTCIAIPVLLMAKLLHDWVTDGFDPNDTVRAVLSITGMLVVASVSSFYMGRALFSTRNEDPAEHELEDDPRII